MSRTIRRNQKHLLHKKFGLPSDTEAYHFATFSKTGGWLQWVEWHPRYESKDHYIRAMNRFQSDSHRRYRTAPRWWKMIHFIGPERRDAKHEIYRCMSQGHFDDHLDPHYRGANWLYWWHMT